MMNYQMGLSLENANDPIMRGQPDDEAIRMIREFEPMALQLDPRGYCVCTSEGKDSRVLGHLFRRAGVKHFYLHNITGIDPPELVYFQRHNFQEYQDAGYLTYDVMYEYSMWQLMKKKKIPPFRTRRYCCEFLKERRTIEQANSILSFGVRKKESVKRAAHRDALEIIERGNKHTIMSFDNDENRRSFENCMTASEKRINPIVDWANEDIWSYSKEAHLEQSSLYEEGFERLGCIGCPMAGECGRRREFDRWPKFEKLYRWAFGQMIEARKQAGLPTFKYGADADTWFDWWMSDRAQDEPFNENQMSLYNTNGGDAV